MRYFFHIAYNGSEFRGWQRQQGITSVQQTIEEQFSEILKTPVVCLGCGRTDAGVHASQYFFHINIKEPISQNIIFLLNKRLPNSISVYNFFEVNNVHAQFDAIERTYDYYFHTQKNPFLAPFSSYYEIPEDNINEMKKIAALLPAYSDYRAFCKTPEKHNHTFCEIKSCSLTYNEAEKSFHFQITANRFLRGMIRLLVAKIIEIGQKRFHVDAFIKALESGERPPYMNYAYPQGLYLSKIIYPSIGIPNVNKIFKKF